MWRLTSTVAFPSKYFGVVPVRMTQVKPPIASNAADYHVLPALEGLAAFGSLTILTPAMAAECCVVNGYKDRR